MMVIEYGKVTVAADVSALFVATLFHFGGSVGTGLTFAAVLRAAVVPSQPRYTIFFTTMMGIAPAVAFLLPPEPFGWVPPVAVSSLPSGATPWHNVAVWWVFTVVIATVISDVVHGFGVRSSGPSSWASTRSKRSWGREEWASSIARGTRCCSVNRHQAADDQAHDRHRVAAVRA